MSQQVPPLIPIAWLPGLETEYVGRTRDGERQLMGFCLTLPPRETAGADSPETQRWVAFVHLFGLDGSYLGTLFKDHGSLAENPQARDLAQAELHWMLEELGPLEYGDIAVQPFTTRVGGSEAGLVIAQSGGEAFAVLEPNGLAFKPPFDGDYEVLTQA